MGKTFETPFWILIMKMTNDAALASGALFVFGLLSLIAVATASAQDGRLQNAASGDAKKGDQDGGGATDARDAKLKPGVAVRLDNLNLLPGFAVERIHIAAKETQGSWVSLCKGPKGRLIASDQGGGGLYWITPAELGVPQASTVIEKMNIPLSGAQGLCWAFDSLYVNVNGQHGGVWRVTDSDGNGKLDKADHLLPLGGAGEHGAHAIILAPDAKALLVVAGNFCNPPQLTSSRIPTNWQDDRLLPIQWDPRGFARGRSAPGGWMARMSPDGTQVEMFSVGYRNQYDVAVNRDGEMFTFDADMEWDMGTPWYRPTRISHVVSGSEFGWRSGSGKWPPYYEDSLPPVLDIGPGSPTGVVFGTGAKFPAKYQDALYVLDWTFGTIHCVHLTPSGASYTATKEDFVSGVPLPVTDAVVGDDGAFYFTVGGRGTQSALYRIFYEGDQPTAPSLGSDSPKSVAARALRHRLEAFHGRQDAGAVDTAWPHLASNDRYIRYAARIAIENQPTAQWQDRALKETKPQAAIFALMALCRQGDKSLQPKVLDALTRLNPASLSEQHQLALLRTYGLCSIRLGEPTAQQRRAVINRLDSLYPSTSDPLNAELARLLVYVDSPTVINKTLKLMADAKSPAIPQWAEQIKRNSQYGNPIRRMLDNMPPLQEIRYALVLSNAHFGWTIQQRRQYFEWFTKAGKQPGGVSYAGFLSNIRKDALARCSDAERQALADVTGQKIELSEEIKVTPPTGPGRKWTLDGAVALGSNGLHRRNFTRGRNLYHAASCVKCHRFHGRGGDVGPDLSSVANRFSLRDLLESILDPSKVISDQYGSHVVITTDGKQALGRVIDDNPDDADGVILVYTQDVTVPPVKIKKTDIEAIKPSAISQMAAGLLDPLNEDELLDLVAYLLSRGNPEDPMFATFQKFDVEFPAEIDPHRPVNLTAKIQHNFAADTWGTVRLSDLPAGWKVLPSPDGKRFSMAPRQPSVTTELEVLVPSDAPHPYGNHRFWVEATVEGRAVTGRYIQVRLPKLTRNIALKAIASTPDGLPQQPGRSASLNTNRGDLAINDGNHHTFTQKKRGADEYLVELNWPSRQRFNALELHTRWNGGFQSFDILCDERKVKTVNDLHYVIPPENPENHGSALVRFDEVEAKTLRLRVFKCYHNAPVIFELGVYRLP